MTVVSFTGHQSSRPACEGKFTVNVANTAGFGFGKAPNNFSITGTTNKYPLTRALTGLPGKPITAFPAHTPRIVGLPGRVLMPWTNTPGSPKERTISAVMSCVEADDPAVMITKSHSESAFAAVSFMTSNLSGTIP